VAWTRAADFGGRARAGRVIHVFAVSRREMVVVRPGTPEQRVQNVVGAEAGSFVHFLIDRYGRDSVARVYSKGASVLEAAYGKPLTQLEQEWHQRLESVESGSTSCLAVVNAALPRA